MANDEERSKTRTDTAVELGGGAQIDGTLRRNRTVIEVAADLAEKHWELDKDATIYVDKRREDAVFLVEVSPNVGDTGEVLAFKFSATEDFDLLYDFHLALLSPQEWKRVMDGRLALPAGWGEPGQFEVLREREGA